MDERNSETIKQITHLVIPLQAGIGIMKKALLFDTHIQAASELR